MRPFGLAALLSVLGFAPVAHATQYTENVSITPVITGTGTGRFGEGSAAFTPITLLPGDTFNINVTFNRLVNYGDESNMGAHVDAAIVNNYNNESHIYYRDYYDGLKGLITTPVGSADPFGGFVNSYGYSLIGMFGGDPGSYAVVSGTDFAFNGVPEPATWATMILGLLGAGIVLRQAKRERRAPLANS